LGPVTPRRLLLPSVASVLGLALLSGCSSTSTVESGDGDLLDELVAPAEGESTPTLDEQTAEVVAGEITAVDDSDVEQIVMIGDSITAGSLGPLEERFGALGYPDTVIEAKSGKRIDVGSDENRSGTAVAATLLQEAEWSGDTDHTDELWIVALGTNDLGQYPTAGEIGFAIDSLLAEVPADAELIWIDTYIVDREADVALVNDTIVERIAIRGDSTLAEWSEVARREGVLSSDGVHPTDIGSEVFAATVVASAANAITN